MFLFHLLYGLLRQNQGFRIFNANYIVFSFSEIFILEFHIRFLALNFQQILQVIVDGVFKAKVLQIVLVYQVLFWVYNSEHQIILSQYRKSRNPFCHKVKVIYLLFFSVYSLTSCKQLLFQILRDPYYKNFIADVVK